MLLFRYVENAVVLRFMRWASCYIIFILDLLFSSEIMIKFVILGLPNLIFCGIFVKIKSDKKKLTGFYFPFLSFHNTRVYDSKESSDHYSTFVIQSAQGWVVVIQAFLFNLHSKMWTKVSLVPISVPMALVAIVFFCSSFVWV